MGLFGRRINARVREQVKRIFSTNTSSETGDMSQASEQSGSLHKAMGQDIPPIIKVDKKNISPVLDASVSKHASMITGMESVFNKLRILHNTNSNKLQWCAAAVVSLQMPKLGLIGHVLLPLVKNPLLTP
ncbi:hypothetical protein TcWFU_003332 [Taenia crassiceps]|uniref:Uncharacterized protein n=1 Tax=Taenia crassiceps TaxID=6207 RepID=A0ABR4QPT1_9CEST